MVSMENKIGVVLTLLHLASIMLLLMLINKMDLQYPKPKRFDIHFNYISIYLDWIGRSNWFLLGHYNFAVKSKILFGFYVCSG